MATVRAELTLVGLRNGRDFVERKSLAPNAYVIREVGNQKTGHNIGWTDSLPDTQARRQPMLPHRQFQRDSCQYLSHLLDALGRTQARKGPDVL